jgi:hypothetical protein
MLTQPIDIPEKALVTLVLPELGLNFWRYPIDKIFGFQLDL